MKTLLPHFPLTSGYYEFEELSGSVGQHFRTDIVPMGQLHIGSGRLAIGDPLLGMTSGANPWRAIAPGSYSVVLTRLLCLDRQALALPAYLSIVLDAEAIEARRQRQGGESDCDYPEVESTCLAAMAVDEAGQYIEADEYDEEQAWLVSKSGVICLVDEDAFERRMPNPLEIQGGWFERFFETSSRESWTRAIDNEDHLVAGAANIPLPQGPDDWDETPPTIALAQMMGAGDAQVYLEYEAEDERHLSPIAIHIELGTRARVLPDY